MHCQSSHQYNSDAVNVQRNLNACRTAQSHLFTPQILLCYLNVCSTKTAHNLQYYRTRSRCSISVALLVFKLCSIPEHMFLNTCKRSVPSDQLVFFLVKPFSTWCSNSVLSPLTLWCSISVAILAFRWCSKP